ncbi:glycoside hydrolase family 127 protein [Anaerobium acetethylicum]|uniref:Glycoside hydrolase family 127 protein n=1 Tax=Anaerobium acetethylicum TaxID=1619234 RepID=A0A1D3TY31_9FIRM|nr:beta-L-arabinofuranosidase domain-containing protein [Anaerobium acetethylicum]SCP99301.1 hypothetical protein SAMN05421730_103711 [Anaerobium acetethylicum]
MFNEKKKLGKAFKEPVYTFRGFEALPEDMEHLEDRFYGFVFQDSDFSKWIEAVAYSLVNHPDEKLEEIADGAIDIVCAAQLENGYLDTYYIINGMDKSFSNLKDHHELYCFGHLAEGAVAYYQATGKDKLLKAAMRFADYIDSVFGPEKEKSKGYPGHEIAEMALVRLYEATGEERYLELGRFFINERGRQPYYWDCETEGKKQEGERYQYHQAHRPVREQDEAVGHAVRAMYLYSGMADVARLTGDGTLLDSCKRLWNSTVWEKMYITGGVGGTSIGEAFSFPFDLPNDLAYAETCASIGLIFFARRMLEMEADSQYADVMEQALYNTVLSGMALDGKSFFYVNPLEVLPEACHLDERKQHVKPVRQKWFGCACCPPNLARLVSSIPSYAYTETEDSLYMHLHMAGIITKEIDGRTAVFQVQSQFPWSGKVTVTYAGEGPVRMKLAVRIPGWCRNWNVQGSERYCCSEEKGYYVMEGSWQPGDQLDLDFIMEPRFYQADDRVRENIGKIAALKGPVVYCAEEADNGKELHLIRLNPKADIKESKAQIGGKYFPVLNIDGYRKVCSPDAGNLYHEYREDQEKETEVKLIPYYAWANRGENEMMVWMRQGIPK